MNKMKELKIEDKKVVNALSQVLGVEQKRIRADYKLGKYSIYFKVNDLVAVKIKEFIKKEQYKEIIIMVERFMALFLSYIPDEYKDIVIDTALNKAKESQEKLDKVMEIMNNEPSKDN